MGFRCGIVGLPNVGKSTLFNALTNAGVAAANYPFCTIDPNVGAVPVPDQRLDRLSELVKPATTVPTVVEFVDIAGLVSGASQGEGLGNRFLAHIRNTHAIAHIVRCFDHREVQHVANRVAPLSDIETINTELLLADIETLERALAKLNKLSRQHAPEAAERLSVMHTVCDHLHAGREVRQLSLDEKHKAIIEPLHLLTAKPMMLVANSGEEGHHNREAMQAVHRYAQQHAMPHITICAQLEAELMELNEHDRRDFMQDAGIKETGLASLIVRGYQLLGLLTFFTAGPHEVHAWTVKQGTTAAAAAGRIHSDFERGFIRAAVVAYEDYVSCGGEHGARQVGRLRMEGKEYQIQEADVVHFHFNV